MQFEGATSAIRCFCIQYSRLFSKFGDKDDDDLGRPRCGDCASKARLAEAVGFASRNQELQARSTLSRLIAQHDAEERIRRGEEGKDDEGNSSNHTTRGGAASSVDERESGVAALHGLVVQTRREATTSADGRGAERGDGRGGGQGWATRRPAAAARRHLLCTGRRQGQWRRFHCSSMASSLRSCTTLAVSARR